MARDLIIDVITKSDERGLDNTAKGLDRVGESSNRTTRSFKAMADESGHVDREITRLRSTIADMHKEIDRTGGDKGMFGDLRKAKADLRQFEQVAAAIAPEIGQTLSKGIASGMDAGGGQVKGVLIALLVGAAVAAAPAVGAVVAGAVTTAVGGSAVALGIAAAAQDSRVKAAAADVWHSIGAEFARDGDVLVGPVIKSLGILRQAFSNLHLEQAFAVVAPLVERIAKGLAGFSFQFGDQFNQAIQAAMPALAAFADQLPLVGYAIGAMFHRIAESRGTVSGIIFLMQEFAAVLMGVGNVIGWLSDRFADLVELGAEFGLVLRAFGLGNLADQFDQLAAAQNRMGESTANAGYAAVKSQVYLGDLANMFASTTMSVQGLKDALDKLFGAQMSVDQALLQTQTDTLALKTAVDQHGATLMRNTEEGLSNRRMLLGLVGDYESQRQAAIKAGTSTGEATRKFDSQVAALIKLAEKLGFSKSEIDHLLGSYKHLHDAPDIKKEITFHINTVGQVPVLGKAQYSFGDGGWVPGPPGAPVPAVVHGGEYVISRDQMAGRGVTGGGQGPGPFGGAGGGYSRFAQIVPPAGSLESVLFGWLRKFVQDNYGGDIVAAMV